MVVEQVGVETSPFRWVEHKTTDEMVNGDDREGLGNKDGFSLLHELEAAGGVRLGESRSEKGVVGGVGPTRTIIAATCDKAVEKSIRVVVISDPAGAGYIEIEFIEGAKVGSPLLVAEFYGYAELAFPLGLDFDGELLVELRFIVEQ